jgi:hypothetical protein
MNNAPPPPPQQQRQTPIIHNPLHLELQQLQRQSFDGARLAEERLLQAMDHHHHQVAVQEQNDENNKVDEICFNIVIMGYVAQAGRGDRTAPTRAEQVLANFHQFCSTSMSATTSTRSQGINRGPLPKPSVFTYNAVMEAHVKSSTNSYSNNNNNQSSGGTSYQRSQAQTSRTIQHTITALQRLWKEMESQGIEPNTFSYNLLLKLYTAAQTSSSFTNSYLKQAEALVQAMEQSPKANVAPDRQTYNLLLAAYGRSTEPSNISLGDGDDDDDQNTNAHKAQALLDRLLQHEDNDQKSSSGRKKHSLSPPSPVWFHCVLRAWANHAQGDVVRSNREDRDDRQLPDLANTRQRQQEAARRADDMMLQMQMMSQSMGLQRLRPDVTTYNHVMNVHAQCGNVERVQELLHELETLASAQESMAPDCISYTTLLKALLNSASLPDERKAQQALQVLQHFQQQALKHSDNPMMQPNIITYNTVIQMLAASGSREGLYKATELLRQMQHQPTPSYVASTTRAIFYPDAITYSSLIHGWSKSGLRDAGYRAEELLHELEQWNHGNGHRQRQLSFVGSEPVYSQGLDLDVTKVYNSVITAWAKSGDPVAVQRVESLLNLLEHKFYAEQKNRQPWNYGNGSSRPTHPAVSTFTGGSPLTITVGPDRTSFLCVADTYAKCGIPNAEAKCDALLERIQALIDAGANANALKPDRTLYNSILNALAKSCQPSSVEKAEEIVTMMETSSDVSLQPDIVSYATLMDCYTKSNSGGDGMMAGKRADEILRFVEGKYRSGDVRLQPNPVFYSAILQAWAKTGTIEGATKAEQLLRRNEGLYQEGYEYAKPHTILYNAVMDAIARTKTPDAGQRAEDLLREMESLYYQGGIDDMKPTRRSFNAVLLAYRYDAQHGADKAEQLLRRMEELCDFDTTTEQRLRPNVVAYNCAMAAIVEHANVVPNAAERCQAIFDRMQMKRMVKPDAISYSLVMEAWLKQNDETGWNMAETLLQKFLTLVDEGKRSHHGPLCNADPVWDVINAYQRKRGGTHAIGMDEEEDVPLEEWLEQLDIDDVG